MGIGLVEWSIRGRDEARGCAFLETGILTCLVGMSHAIFQMSGEKEATQEDCEG